MNEDIENGENGENIGDEQESGVVFSVKYSYSRPGVKRVDEICVSLLIISPYKTNL
jgi:hypothetical protein